MNKSLIDGVEIQNALLCEDLRPEQNGKWTILGAFSGDIVVPSLPTNIKLTAYIEIFLNKKYRGNIHFRMLLDGAECMKISGKMEGNLGYSAIPLPQFIVGIPKPGSLVAEISTDGQNWLEIIKRRLSIGKFDKGILISSNEPQQPSAQS